MRQNNNESEQKVVTGLGIALVICGIAAAGIGAAAISFELGIATQMAGGVATTDLLIVGGTIMAAVGGFIAGASKYPGMLIWTAIWSVAFSIAVSTFSTSLLYTSLPTQFITWFGITASIAASILGLSNYLAHEEYTRMSFTKIALCSLVIGTVGAIAATALPMFSQTFIQEPSLVIFVNIASTVLLAEALVAVHAIKEHWESLHQAL